jgi:hypothetical protein
MTEVNAMYVNQFGPCIFHKDCPRESFYVAMLGNTVGINKESVLRNHIVCESCGGRLTSEDDLIEGSVKYIKASKEIKKKFLFWEYKSQEEYADPILSMWNITNKVDKKFQGMEEEKIPKVNRLESVD